MMKLGLKISQTQSLFKSPNCSNKFQFQKPVQLNKLNSYNTATVPDCYQNGDPGEAVQGVEEDDQAPEPEAEVQQEDTLVVLNCGKLLSTDINNK